MGEEVTFKINDLCASLDEENSSAINSEDYRKVLIAVAYRLGAELKNEGFTLDADGKAMKNYTNDVYCALRDGNNIEHVCGVQQ